jgi:hypothetical protein
MHFSLHLSEGGRSSPHPREPRLWIISPHKLWTEALSKGTTLETTNDRRSADSPPRPCCRRTTCMEPYRFNVSYANVCSVREAVPSRGPTMVSCEPWPRSEDRKVLCRDRLCGRRPGVLKSPGPVLGVVDGIARGVLQHGHAGRLKSVVASSLGVDPKTVRKYVAAAERPVWRRVGAVLARSEWAELVRGWFPELVDARARSARSTGCFSPGRSDCFASPNHAACRPADYRSHYLRGLDRLSVTKRTPLRT